MRPGRLTPENRVRHSSSSSVSLASMRPGRLTPENLEGKAGTLRWCAGFNEAGAINPGKPTYSMHKAEYDRDGFNEAGAINPGKPSSLSACSSRGIALQ